MQRTNEEILAAYDRHADTVYRIAYAFLKNMNFHPIRSMQMRSSTLQTI